MIVQMFPSNLLNMVYKVLEIKKTCRPSGQIYERAKEVDKDLNMTLEYILLTVLYTLFNIRISLEIIY